MITRRLARERGYSKHRQQQTWQTFREPVEVPNRGFGALESLNEVLLRAGGSVTLESPHDGEILTYVHEGTLAYQDNLGRSGILQAGEFQCMTAGGYTRFDGTNPSRKQGAHIFQMWLGPSPHALDARLEQQRFGAAERRGGLHPVASPDRRNQSLCVQQDAVLFSGILGAGQHVIHELHQGRRAWLQVVRGQLSLDDLALEIGDGVGVTAERSVSFTARSASEVLLLDLCARPARVSPGSNGGESVALLDGGAEAYPRMLRALAGAKRTVHMEVYAFARSGVGAQFINALMDAVARGVRVTVVLDGWGSARDGRSIASALCNAGCTVTIHNPLLALLAGKFGRNHRKVLLVDETVAFLGGINIGDENLDNAARLGWADLAVEIHGDECMRLSQMIRQQPQHRTRGSLRIHLSALGGGWRMRKRYLEAFERARKRIHVAHGYFLPDAAVVRSIIAAARRGVQVHLLLAGRSDVLFARMATRSLHSRLLAAGVRIHEWTDSVLHAKVATVDGSLLLVGSFNLDPFSLVNLESLVEVRDSTVVGQGEAWIQDHFARARVMTVRGAGSRWQAWLLWSLGRMFARAADAAARLIASRHLRRQPRSGLRRGEE